MPSLFVLGLTGPTGAGKSLVAARLVKEGFELFDADVYARRAVAAGSSTLKAIALAFGDGILAQNGTLDRKALAAIVFSDPASLERLNAITHPAIVSLISGGLEAYRRKGGQIAVLDAPALFESGADRLCHYIVAVVASKESRAARIIARDSLTREQAAARVEAQPPMEFYTQRADTVIENNGSERGIINAAAALAQTARIRWSRMQK